MDFQQSLPNSGEYARVYNRVKSRLDVGLEEQKTLVEKVEKLTIRDKLVPPRSMTFFSADIDETSSQLMLKYDGDEQFYEVHRHALSQLSAKIATPGAFISRLSEGKPWEVTLCERILNQHFTNMEFQEGVKFLHRLVGNQLRGFVSRRFNRHIASKPLLEAFLSACASVGAFPVEALITDVRMNLKCMLPYVFEPVTGQFMCAGVEWSNSDFGAGRMQVAMLLWRPTVGSFSVVDQTLSRVHIGSIIESEDIDISDDTAKKEAQAQASAVKDAVRSQLSESAIDKLLDAVREADAQQIPWTKLKGQLAKYITKKDIEKLEVLLTQPVTDLPVVNIGSSGTAEPTKWWASSALSWLSQTAQDPDDKISLQQAAGSFLEVK